MKARIISCFIILTHRGLSNFCGDIYIFEYWCWKGGVSDNNETLPEQITTQLGRDENN